MKAITRFACAVVTLAIGSYAQAHGDPEPGLWEFRAELAVPTSPAFEQVPMTTRQCVKAVEARDPSRILMIVSNPGARSCRFLDKHQGYGHADFTVFCEGLFSISGRGSVDFSPDRLHGNLEMSFVAGSTADAQRVNASSRVAARRIGSCVTGNEGLHVGLSM